MPDSTPIREIYLDHAASSPLRPEARAAWLAAVDQYHANPTGAHGAARAARRALDDARDAIAAAVGASAGDVVFTSGGSEADNLAIRGAIARHGGVAVCSAAEHHAVLHPVELSGGSVVPTTKQGTIDLVALGETLDSIVAAGNRVCVVSTMLVNNETGAIADLDAVAAVIRAHAPGAWLHTDAVQAMAWTNMAERAAAADLISITAHKVGGPVGNGALIMREGVTLEPQIAGGSQERERRAGTQDVAGALAFAAAVQAAVTERPEITARCEKFRAALWAGLKDRLGDSVIDTLEAAEVADADRSPGVLHVCLPGLESEALLYLLDERGLRASAASSCASGAQEPSHVLSAMSIDRDTALGSLRLSFGYTTTSADIDGAIDIIDAAVTRLRLFS